MRTDSSPLIPSLPDTRGFPGLTERVHPEHIDLYLRNRRYRRTYQTGFANNMTMGSRAGNYWISNPRVDPRMIPRLGAPFVDIPMTTNSLGASYSDNIYLRAIRSDSDLVGIRSPPLIRAGSFPSSTLCSRRTRSTCLPGRLETATLSISSTAHSRLQMMDPSPEPCFEGGCSCGSVRYRLLGKPLIVHCCHCTWCQRESGSAFVINALFSSDCVVHLNSEPVIITTPSESGSGQPIARCPQCYVPVWSNYRGGGQALRFVRVGTLDQPHAFSPDVHIYTRSKVPWVDLPQNATAYEAFYDVDKVWGKEADERRYAVLSKVRAAQAGPSDSQT